ncbi:MAG: Glycosyltransferase [Candidatus Falkowbacteria bacterium GW2011_GWC2_38_22]|nr:MAG: Glycosyltransferase [Candidatus Falkowbacteria bacterium GW2011_GWF2_38_1205]KKQ60601.1 MAG: Glycosyltransferase [Candidatus Falkowbacteria bacterium GW2011_GWC2_38_22]KKQ62692.1 MAG: Glycosyltransferase [Candidatus Falkowbacteria bacterium GW2011_GWF1_38_22]KKQ64819.1 MAG: Glycosyltransferase [Candidatus Falkowbacteria bacterium GW2011_GWE2_38_254]KKQ72061.1 MAG: Glycosyltransferase [Candidatus Falkowbacteria bacterium GW2011_GWD2_38_42]
MTKIFIHKYVKKHKKMKILNFSLDSSILNKNSVSAKRMIEYGCLVEKYLVIVPSTDKKEIFLNNKTSVIGSGGKNKICQLFGIYKTAKKILQKEKFDCISAQDPFEVGLIGLVLSSQFKISLNVQDHGDFFSQKYWRQESFLHLLRYYVGAYVIKKSDSIRVVSNRIKDYLIVNFYVKPEKIINVPVYTACEEFEKVNKINKEDNFVFLNLGRFVKQKNLPLLLNAFSQVIKKHSEARLILIGRGPEEKNLKNICAELKIENAVEFLDWTENVKDCYAEADVYVLPSNYEGWGRVIIEAAATGLPIVMTDVGCAGEAVINEESALISSVNDLDGFTKNMLRIIEDKDLRLRLSESAIQAIKKLPNKDETLGLYLESWKLALNKNLK